ncbi:MAG: NADH-quinone oxidoreductase subunit NuoK [Hydrogenobacter sp.]|uniref:NADH-quinone oxidoreductase subunit NuoK n=1 Tax=Hydrogenobacter thermophilus TaxID=940 RepID=UPI0030F5FBE0
MSVEKFYLLLSLFLFLLGFFGILIRKNLLTILVSTELMLNGINLAFVSIDKMLGKVEGQVFALFILTVAAAEVAVGLGIIISIFRLRGYEGSSETVHLRD